MMIFLFNDTFYRFELNKKSSPFPLCGRCICKSIKGITECYEIASNRQAKYCYDLVHIISSKSTGNQIVKDTLMKCTYGRYPIRINKVSLIEVSYVRSKNFIITYVIHS